MLVYFFKNQISPELMDKLKENKPTIPSYIRSEVWVYKVDSPQGKLALINNKPLTSKREVVKAIGIHNTVLNKYLDTKTVYRKMLFFLHILSLNKYNVIHTHIAGCLRYLNIQSVFTLPAGYVK